MRFVTYISSVPKKYQTAAENMSNLIQEIFHISYATWKLNYIKSKIRWMFPSYIGNATSLTDIFGPKNSESKKYYITFIESGCGLTFFINYKKKGENKSKPFSCVLLDPEDWYFRPRHNNSN